MTYKKWSLIYRAYKSNYDLEFSMGKKNLRYMDLEKEETLDDLIPF